MKNFCIFLGFILLTASAAEAFEYHWDNTAKKNLQVESGSYVVRPEGVFFNLRDTKHNKIYTMQQYTSYSDSENRFYYHLGISQSCSPEEYLKYDRESCSPLTAKSAANFEIIDPDNSDEYKWQLITLSLSRAEYIKHNPMAWVVNYYRTDIEERIKKSFIREYKKAKRVKNAPKIKPPLYVFVEVSYTILRDGSLKDANVSASSGNEFFNKLAINAVKSAEPFLVFPLSTDRNSIECIFRYELKIPSTRKFEEKFINKVL